MRARSHVCRPWQPLALALVFFVAGIYAGWRHEPTTRAFLADTQLYYYIAERVASGEPPHVSLIDHKHQLAAMLSGWAIRTGRAFGVDDVIAVRTASLVAAGITVAAVVVAATQITASYTAGVVAGLSMLVFTDFFTEAAMGVRPQVFMAMFAALALAFYGRGRTFLAGMAASGAFLCWQPAALIGVALAASALVRRDRISTLVRLAGGALVAVALYELYFVYHGALAEQLRQSYLMPAKVAAYRYESFADSVRFFMRMGWRRVDSARALSALMLVVLTAAPLIIAAWPRRAFALFRDRPVALAALLASYLSVAFTLAQHNAYPDMFFVYPFMAIAAGAVVAAVCSMFVRAARVSSRPFAARSATVAQWLLIGACAAWLLTLHVRRTNMLPRGPLTLTDQIDLARQVDILFDDRGSVWAVGCPHLLALAHKKNAHPLGLLLDSKVRAYVTEDGPAGRYYPGSDGRLPGAIIASRVVPWVWFPELRRHYVKVVNRSFERARTGMFVLRDPPPGGRRTPVTVRR